MMIPIRCFTCGTPIAHKHDDFKEKSASIGPAKALDELSVTRYCCRRMFLGQTELMEEIKKYPRF